MQREVLPAACDPLSLLKPAAGWHPSHRAACCALGGIEEESAGFFCPCIPRVPERRCLRLRGASVPDPGLCFKGWDLGSRSAAGLVLWVVSCDVAGWGLAGGFLCNKESS